MTEDESQAQAVGPALPILATIGWILLAAVLAMPALFSPMLFDSGGSGWAVLIVLGLFSTLLLCALSVIASWVVWALTRERHRGGARIGRGIAYLLPVIGLAMTTLGLAGIQLLCGGSVNCAT